ncbi:putative uridylyltransferase [Cucumispora dikerogammari]|nr:putative uridylyltransferase [Cucumispora dikerogammari]
MFIKFSTAILVTHFRNNTNGFYITTIRASEITHNFSASVNPDIIPLINEDHHSNFEVGNNACGEKPITHEETIDNIIIDNKSETIQSTSPMHNTMSHNEDTSNYLEKRYLLSKTCLLILAGGQSSRLGTDMPKGVFPIYLSKNTGPNVSNSINSMNDGIKSDEYTTLFKLHFKKIQALNNKYNIILKVIIMCSPENLADTKKYISSIYDDEVHYLVQGVVPCLHSISNDKSELDSNNDYLRDSKNRIIQTPDGNGGVFIALHNKGYFEKFKSWNVDVLNTVSVDNARVNFLDTNVVKLFYPTVDNVNNTSYENNIKGYKNAVDTTNTINDTDTIPGDNIEKEVATITHKSSTAVKNIPTQQLLYNNIQHAEILHKRIEYADIPVPVIEADNKADKHISVLQYDIISKGINMISSKEQAGTFDIDPYTHKLSVIEYSERKPDQKNIHYEQSVINICHHYFSINFLMKNIHNFDNLPYHLAYKNISYYETETDKTNDVEADMPYATKLEMTNGIETNVGKDMETNSVGGIKTDKTNDVEADMPYATKVEMSNGIETNVGKDMETNYVCSIKTDTVNDIEKGVYDVTKTVKPGPDIVKEKVKTATKHKSDKELDDITNPICDVIYNNTTDNNTPNNNKVLKKQMGWKQEKFIFDIFEFSDNSRNIFVVVDRQEFLPLKNLEGEIDSLLSVRRGLVSTDITVCDSGS